MRMAITSVSLLFLKKMKTDFEQTYLILKNLPHLNELFTYLPKNPFEGVVLKKIIQSENLGSCIYELNYLIAIPEIIFKAQFCKKENSNMVFVGNTKVPY